MNIPASLPAVLVLVACGLPVSSPHAQTRNACELLRPTDLTALLGGTATAKQSGAGCIWSVGNQKLVALVYKAAGPAAEMAYQGAHHGAERDGTVNDETGVGDKAFTSLTSFGVVVVMLKQGRLLQLQYWTGTSGTAKDAGALLPVAKKAIAMY
jgi:hypothetical protein